MSVVEITDFFYFSVIHILTAYSLVCPQGHPIALSEGGRL